MHHLRDQKYKSKNEIFKQYIEKQNSKGKKFGIQNSKKNLGYINNSELKQRNDNILLNYLLCLLLIWLHLKNK